MKYIFYFSFLSALLAVFMAFALYCPVLASDTAGESIQSSTGHIIGSIIESAKQGLLKTIDWIKYIWNSYIKLKFKETWQKINSFLGKEIVETEIGTFNCLKFSPMMATGEVFDDPYPLSVWITDDKNHIPVLLESKIIVGSVKIELIKYSGLANPLTSEIE